MNARLSDAFIVVLSTSCIHFKSSLLIFLRNATSSTFGVTATGCGRIRICYASGPTKTESGQVPREQVLTLRRALRSGSSVAPLPASRSQRRANLDGSILLNDRALPQKSAIFNCQKPAIFD